MHDKLFGHQYDLSETKLRKTAEDLGLNMRTFDRDFYDAAVDRQVQRDIDEAKKFGAKGTPTFFINGRYLGGAHSKGAFDKVIEEELRRAKTYVERRGGTRKGLYEAMIGHFAPELVKPRSGGTALADDKRFLVPTSGLPQRGGTGTARVSIVECGDFDCPYCARAHKTLPKVLDAYPTQVTLYFAHHPLEFHKGAKLAARAAEAAAKQDKFWEMHDLLFEKQTGSPRSKSDLIGYARALSLDIPRFDKDLDDAAHDKTIEKQQKLCKDNEASGTPTFFIKRSARGRVQDARAVQVADR